jgi:hypothetical protein
MMTTLGPSKELGWEYRKNDKDKNDESMDQSVYSWIHGFNLLYWSWG